MKIKPGAPRNIMSKLVRGDKQEPGSLRPVDELYDEINEWRCEHETWLEDIEEWHREHKLAELVLYKMERALPDHNRALEDHASIIHKHSNRIGRHERNLKNYIAGGQQDNKKHHALIKEHLSEDEQHTRERKRHDSFRETHKAAMAELVRISQLLQNLDNRPTD